LQWRNRAKVCGTIVWVGPHEFRDEGKQDLRMVNPFFEHPILNSPYLCPARHWELDEQGQPTQKIIDNRRRAEFITPIREVSGHGVSDHFVGVNKMVDLGSGGQREVDDIRDHHFKRPRTSREYRAGNLSRTHRQ
jgi:hypothetical protein